MHRGVVTYRNGKDATWVDHVFVSQVLLDTKVVFAAGVLDKRQWHDEAKVASSLHNMVAIGVDFRRLLHIGPEVAANLLQEPAYRMPYIHGDKKRAEYGADIQAALEVAGVGAMLDEAAGVLLKLQQAREAERRVLNRPRDRASQGALAAG